MLPVVARDHTPPCWPMRLLLCTLLSTVIAFRLAAETKAGLEPIPRAELPGPAKPQDDPIAALGEGDDERVRAGLTTLSVSPFVAGLIERIESHHRAKLPAPVLTWLGTRPAVRRDFWLALDPADDVTAVGVVLEGLLRQQAAACARLPQLAIATALVWDQPRLVVTGQRLAIWGVNYHQFPVPLGPDAVFAWLAGGAKHLACDITALPWQALVHVVDNDLDAADREWGQQRYRLSPAKCEQLFFELTYDHQKLLERKGQLGARDYSLANLLKYGGVCGDQAWYGSRLAKAQGVPSCIVLGLNSAGLGHAWHAYAVTPKAGTKGWRLATTGRYPGDRYYQGEVFDPQTGRTASDRDFALVIAGTTTDATAFAEARALARCAAKLRVGAPALCRQLAEAATKRSPYVAQGWRLLAGLAADGAIGSDTALATHQRLVAALPDHPDLDWECLQGFVAAHPTLAGKLYPDAFLRFRAADRPDLQIAVRAAQADTLVADGALAKASDLVNETCAGMGAEGLFVLPLIERCVDLALARQAADARFGFAKVHRALANAESGFPMLRYQATTPAYLRYLDLVGKLHEPGWAAKHWQQP